MIYVVTGLPRTGTTYLMRCLQAGGCTIARYRKHTRMEIGTAYRVGHRNIEGLIKACRKAPYDPKRDYALKIFPRQLPSMEYHKDVVPILTIRDHKSLLASCVRTGILNAWPRMGKRYLEQFYDLYFEWLKETWPATEEIMFPYFKEWAENTMVPVKIIPYDKEKDG